VTTTTTTPPGGASGTFADGRYRIGQTLAARTYRTQVNSSGRYWERESGFSGQLSDIIANNLTNFHDVVTILPTDAGFKTQNCGTWTSDLSALTSSPTAPFADGTWIVNTDVGPGTWTAAGGQSCYWARVSAFTGRVEDVVANDLGTTNPTATIAPTDVGFISHSCGSWTKVS